MATTGQLLTWIELECHGWNREGPRGTRALFNEAHRLLLMGELEQNIIYDEDTGDLPFLATHKNVFRYTLPSTYWRVGGILLDASEYATRYQDYGCPYYGGPFASVQQRFEEFQLGGIFYWRIVNCRSRGARQGRSPWVQFNKIDPGETKQEFRVYGWQLPVEILSDSVQHEMPGATDIEYLMPAAMLLIDAISDHSKMEKVREHIVKELKPKVANEMASGEQGIPISCTKRSF